MAADAISNVSGMNLVAILTNVSIFIAVSGLFCFLAYKFVTGKFNKQRLQNRVNSELAASKQAIPPGQLITRGYVATESKKQNPWFMDWVRQTEEANRQRAQESNKKALADIVTMARREIGKERDRAVWEMHREYEGLVLLSDCHNASYKVGTTDI